MLDRIAECEKRVSEDRKELDDLVRTLYETEQPEKEYMEYKIRQLKSEIASINQELAIIQRNMNIRTVYHKEEVTETVYEHNSEFENEFKPEYKDADNEPKHKNRKDLESVVGKNLMGIFASILIFISLVFFATIIYPYLNDATKIIAMYAISFMFLAFGLLKLKGNRESTLYQSVAGCGLGSVYISLLLTNIYFEAISDIPLYILIAVWAVFICVLSKLDSKIFQVIGQLGICISVAFGAELCMDTENIGKFLFLMVYFVVTSVIFLITHFKKAYKKNAINHIFNVISSIILMDAIFYIMPEGTLYGMYLAAFALLFAYAAGNLIISYVLFEPDEKSNACMCIVNCFYAFIAFCSIACILDDSSYYRFVVIIMAVLLFAANDVWLKNKRDIGKHIFNVYLLLVTFIMCSFTIDLFEDLSLAIFIIPLLILGFIREDRSYKCFAIIYSVLFLFKGDYAPFSHLVLALSVVGSIWGMMVWKRSQYNVTLKSISYILLHLYIMEDIIRMAGAGAGETLDFVLFAFHSILNIAAMKTIFSRNWFTKEKEKLMENTANVINGICMFVSLFCISFMQNEVYHIFSIFIALGLFLINSKNLLQKSRSMVPGIYIGIKCTILVTAISGSFNASDYAISIIFFLTAILSIVPGFVFRYKSLRIYGLVLALISIIKLTLFDIVYNSTVERALSFFICGILCFLISMIYNRLDKKFLHI